MFCVLVVLVMILVADRRRLVALIRHYLPPYRATGLVTGDDIAMLGSLRQRRRARAWARAAGGLPAAAAMGDYQLAATELALLHAKTRRGIITAETFAARQHDLLALMYFARRMVARHPGPPPAPWASEAGSAFTTGDRRS
jgi:hypothetical protein